MRNQDQENREKKILIILTGSTYSELRDNLGDFDNWIKQQCYDLWDNWETKRIENIKPDIIEYYDGVIFTGAHSSLTKDYPYLSK